MGIRIELTDDDRFEQLGETIELPDGEWPQSDTVPPGMENLRIIRRWCVMPAESGGVEVTVGENGSVILYSEEEAEDFCEAIIRQIRTLPTIPPCQT